MKIDTKEAFQEYGQKLSSEHGNVRSEALLYALRAGDTWVASMVQEGKFLTLHLLFETLGRPAFSDAGFLNATFTAEQLEKLWNYFTPFHSELEKHPNVQFLAKARETNCPVHVLLLNKDCSTSSNKTAYLEKRTNALFTLFSMGALRGSEAIARQALLDSFAVLPNHFVRPDGSLHREDIVGTQGFEAAGVSGIDKFPSLISLYPERLKADGNRLMHNVWIRDGVFIGKRNIFMSNASVNIAAYIGDDNLIDANASVGSAAQLGNKNKIASFVSLEGVLSPANAQCVMIGDENFLGTFVRIGTGLIIGSKNFIGSGVNLSLGTKLRDCRVDSESRGDYISAKTLTGHFNNLAIVPNNATRNFNGIEVMPGEYLIFENSEEFMARFDGDDRIKAKR